MPLSWVICSLLEGAPRMSVAEGLDGGGTRLSLPCPLSYLGRQRKLAWPWNQFQPLGYTLEIARSTNRHGAPSRSRSYKMPAKSFAEKSKDNALRINCTRASA
jgi:hypothetical protein